MASEEHDLDALYATPPARFVEARKQLARALRAAGRREEAQAVDKLARPTASVWATNQLARRAASAPRVAELLELTLRLRDTQGRSDRGDGGAFAETASAHRTALAALRADAEQILTEDGRAATPQLLGRVVANLRAGAADQELGPRLAAGRLERDVEETGFLGLLEGGLPPAPAPPRPAPAPPAKRAPAPTDAAARKAEAERRRAEEAAAREAERARAAERARSLREAEKLRAAVTAARREIEREARAVREAEEALAAGQRRLDAARAREQELAAALAEAEAALERARG